VPGSIWRAPGAHGGGQGKDEMAIARISRMDRHLPSEKRDESAPASGVDRSSTTRAMRRHLSSTAPLAPYLVQVPIGAAMSLEASRPHPVMKGTKATGADQRPDAQRSASMFPLLVY
jgi:hypothetical protein